MPMRGRLLLLGLAAGWGLWAPVGHAGGDEWQGLPEGEGREEVFYGCQACHSLKLVTQQGLNRESWRETLEWMVEEQGMVKPDKGEWSLMLSYLSKFYGRDRLAAGMAKND